MHLLPCCAEGKPADPDWTGTRIDQSLLYQVRGQQGGISQGTWRSGILEFALYPPYFSNYFKYETDFWGKKSYFMRAVSSWPISMISLRAKAITDNFSVLSRVWRSADTYLFFKESVEVILSCDLYQKLPPYLHDVPLHAFHSGSLPFIVFMIIWTSLL